jgi:hypothetical protein
VPRSSQNPLTCSLLDWKRTCSHKKGKKPLYARTTHKNLRHIHAKNTVRTIPDHGIFDKYS